MSSTSTKTGAISALILIPIAVKILSFANKLASSKDPLTVWNLIQGSKFIPSRVGSWLFYYAVGFANPFSRAINYRITNLKKGEVSGAMKEEKSNRNPFRCVHAAALVLFGETVGGLALFTQLEKKDRAILTHINAEYIKVSRGHLTASSVVSKQNIKSGLVVTEVVIQNSKSETVAKLALTWKTELNGEKAQLA